MFFFVFLFQLFSFQFYLYLLPVVFPVFLFLRFRFSYVLFQQTSQKIKSKVKAIGEIDNRGNEQDKDNHGNQDKSEVPEAGGYLTKKVIFKHFKRNKITGPLVNK